MANKYSLNESIIQHDERINLAESTIRIKDLHEVEEKIVYLLNTASEALKTLSEDTAKSQSDDDDSEAGKFQELATKYFSYIIDIQRELRSHTRHLSSFGSNTPSNSKSIPFRSSVSIRQKELEIWTAAVCTVRSHIENLNRTAHADHVE